MDRRFLTVLGMSLVLALVVSVVVYQISAGGGRGKSKSVEYRDLVTAAQPMAAGSLVKQAALRVTRVPENLFPHGGFSHIEEVVDRPVASSILADEPVLEGRLAARGSGMGLAPIIPPGMRAVSVRVNDVVSVAGYVLPGMRVDVLVTGRPPNYNGTITTTVLQNIVVLSAGSTLQPESHGQAINAPVVTLLVTPKQAEVLTLAVSEGKIQLVLRNSTDQALPGTPGEELSQLFGAHGVVAEPEARPRPRRERPPAPSPPPAPHVAPPPARVPDEIVIIRGNQRSVETVGLRPAPAERNN